MLNTLSKKNEKFLSLDRGLSRPDLLSDMEKYRKKSKEYADLKELITEYDRYLALEEEKVSLEKMISDEGESEYAKLARKELEEVVSGMESKKGDLEDLIILEDAEELRRNVIMEIRAGTGGIEAGLFAGDLYKMYMKYALEKGWKTSVISYTEAEQGCVKEVIFSVIG